MTQDPLLGLKLELGLGFGGGCLVRMLIELIVKSIR
jgi:hypothetical protein